MNLPFRPLMLIATCSVAMLCTACSSNNQGKIEGKWKVVSLTGNEAAQIKEMEQLKVYMFFEFRPDGVLNLGAESSDKNMQEILSKSGEMKVISCKYRLRSGDSVEFYDLPKEMQEKGGGGLFGKNKDKARTNVTIQGDNMTMRDDDGKTGTLVRVK